MGRAGATRGTITETKNGTTKNGTNKQTDGAVQIPCQEHQPPQRGCKCPLVAEDKRRDRVEQVGVEHD